MDCLLYQINSATLWNRCCLFKTRRAAKPAPQAVEAASEACEVTLQPIQSKEQMMAWLQQTTKQAVHGVYLICKQIQLLASQVINGAANMKGQDFLQGTRKATGVTALCA